MPVVWSLSDAQAQFSALITAAQMGQPQIVTGLNEKAVVVLSYADYQRLSQSSLVDFFRSSPLVGIDLELSRDRSYDRNNLDL